MKCLPSFSSISQNHCNTQMDCPLWDVVCVSDCWPSAHLICILTNNMMPPLAVCILYIHKICNGWVSTGIATFGYLITMFSHGKMQFHILESCPSIACAMHKHFKKVHSCYVLSLWAIPVIHKTPWHPQVTYMLYIINLIVQYWYIVQIYIGECRSRGLQKIWLVVSLACSWNKMTWFHAYYLTLSTQTYFN